MKHIEFEVGQNFAMSGRTYRCTDIGKRTVIGIRIDRVLVAGMTSSGVKKTPRELSRDEAEAEGWFRGPPYAVVEKVFDENDQVVCHPC